MTSFLVARPLPWLFVASLGLAAGCGGVVASGPLSPPSSDAGGGKDGGSCASTSDCPTGQQCAWSVTSDSCQSPGTCVEPYMEPCGLLTDVTACGCDGVSFSWLSGCSGLPAEWGPKPSLHKGPCVDDAGSTACTTTADCASGSECAYEVSEACAATGQCMGLEACSCPDSPTSACGCNGDTAHVYCCNRRYANEPIVHEGACADAEP